MDRKFILAAILAAFAGSASAASASADSSASSASASAGSTASSGKSAAVKRESSATFIGRNGWVRVHGDTIEARNGELMVNGVPYGNVDDTSIVKYVASGKKKTLTVNGVPRHPQP